MRRAVQALIVAAAVAVVSAPSVAHADGYIAPWISANAGQNMGTNFDNGGAGFGVNAGGMGGGIVGGELEFGWTPNYFGNSTNFGANHVIDLMGNAIVGIPIGGQWGAGIRPFATGGFGLLRTSINGGVIAPVAFTDNMLGWNLGAGVMGYFNDHVGVRGDLRYLRSFQDMGRGPNNIDFTNGGGQFHFWRAAVGVVLR